MGALKEHFHSQIENGQNLKDDDDDYQMEQMGLTSPQFLMQNSVMDEIENLDEAEGLARFEETFRLTSTYPI